MEREKVVEEDTAVMAREARSDLHTLRDTAALSDLRVHLQLGCLAHCDDRALQSADQHPR